MLDRLNAIGSMGLLFSAAILTQGQQLARGSLKKAAGLLCSARANGLGRLSWLGRSGDRTRTCVGRCRLRSLENWRQWKLGNEHQVGSCRARLFGGGLGYGLRCWAQGLWLGRAAVLDDETGVGSRGYEGN